MGTDEEVIKVEKEKPHIYFNKIIFNDDTELILEKNAIVVFTGANNSGKSQVLKDIELCVDDSNFSNNVVVKKTERNFSGAIDEEEFLEEYFKINNKGLYQIVSSGSTFSVNTLKQFWENRSINNGLYKLFVNRLSTEMRLTASNALSRNIQMENHPIFKISHNEKIAQKVSDYFHQAFGVDLVVNRNEMVTIPLHVGKAPDKKAYTIDRQDEYYKLVEDLPKLQEQGDGMRSFASILLNTFTSDKSITLIDEPEAFLHPPQARVLGKMLANNNSYDRQLFISTHSEDFLHGLLDAENKNVIVIRINREHIINKMSILQNDKIATLWGNPILRYSNILSGLFHEKVVVCESDYDCLFYQAIINAIYEQKNEIAPDLLFTHCGGKTRIKDVVSALKAVNVPVVAITDFDLLNASQNFKPLVGAFGINWDEALAQSMKVIYDVMNAKNSNGDNAWQQVKKIGKIGFDGEAPAEYEKVETICKEAGLFVIPVGEMECFDKTINKEKKDWVYDVLQKYDLATEPKLEEARKFLKEVCDFRIK